MKSVAHVIALGWAGGFLPLLLVSAGCQPIETRFDVLSFKNARKPERFSQRFLNGAFMVNARRNYAIVFELGGDDSKKSETDVSDAVSDAEPSETPMTQLIYIEVFWKPRPGTTYADPTQTNADVSYALVSGKDVVTYEGAGFVFFQTSRDSRTITGQLESATLVPARFVNDPKDLFGPSQMKGSFTAHEDRKRVTEVQRRLHKWLAASKQTAEAPASP